jgi:PEGA domain
VNRQVLIGGVAVALAAGVGLTIYLSRSDDGREAPATTVEAPAATPAVRERAAPAPRTADAPRVARREPEPGEAEAPAPAPIVEAAPEAGTLRIDADVPGAQVFLDRQFIGTAPVVAENVKPGTHQLNVSAEGFESQVQSIDVEVGSRDIAVRFREVRLDAKADVIHKHGIGSCRGRLVATPQGIKYETTNKDDQFTTALLDLETFQVDYLEKNLKIKARRGKQFNFTDPDGNADRLFVFHREVEKARERLKKGDQPATN